MKCCLKFSHVLSASGLSFHAASAKIRALLKMVLPMLMSCGSVSGVPWLSANVVYLCILLKIFATGSSHHGCIGVGVRWLVLRGSSGR